MLSDPYIKNLISKDSSCIYGVKQFRCSKCCFCPKKLKSLQNKI